MAYTVFDYQATVRGSIAGAEEFSNTWSFKVGAESDPEQDLVDLLHTFYDDLANGGTPVFTQLITIDTVRLVRLDTGEEQPVTWASIAAAGTEPIIPAECSIRLSVSAGGRHRGGPFLPPFRRASLDVNGQLLVSYQTVVRDALNDLVDAWAAGGAQIAVNDPTGELLRVATSVKVGRTFDVIRRRRNEMPEAYLSVSIP